LTRFNAASHDRHHWWRALLLRLAVCSGVSGFLWWASGWAGLLVSLMLWAYAMARDLVELGAVLWRAFRRLAFRPVQGRLYQFKGHRIRVEEDELLPQRWLALDDLATALGSPMSAISLRRRWPQGVCEQRGVAYVFDDAALAWLGEQRNDRVGRMRLWLEREIWYPARGRKAGYRAQSKGAPHGAPADD
jgi:hypothetical protein